jgi:hypothetical protein
MTLVMRTAKGAVSFEWNDEDAETVVKIEPTDTDEVMLRKLKRVIALVEGETHLVMRQDGRVEHEPGPLDNRTVVTINPNAATNGWAAAYGPPKVPERLEGEIEVIKPGEEA